MPASGTNSYHRPDHSTLQLPCGHQNCQRYFKTAAGRTKHRLSAHPTIPRPIPSHRSVSPELPDPGNDQHREEDIPRADGVPFDIDHDQPDFEIPRMSSPLPDVNAEFFGPGNHFYRNYHKDLDGRPCDENGAFLPPGTPPSPPVARPADDWTPFRNQTEFETAEFLYTREQMSGPQIDTLLDLWAATLVKYNDRPPFANHKDLYHTIDSSPLGDVPWQSFSVKYCGDIPDVDVPPWMNGSYDVWFRDPREVIRNMLANPMYADEVDYQPYREYASATDERQWKDFMSADWAWDQADEISKDPDTVGATFVPVILGSDKTTVSVGTGNNAYYPLYLSIGNVRNNVRRAHRDAVAIIGFLAMPKSTRAHSEDPRFRKFRRQLFHSSLSKILQTLVPGMTKPEVARFGDGHFRRVIYGLGPYIADYEEQVLLGCIVKRWCARCLAPRLNLDQDALDRCREYVDALVEEGTLLEIWDDYGIVGDLVPFTNDFPRADINQLIAPDLLHQLIKGAFKDHLVDWVEKYLILTHGKREGQRIMDDIDRRIAAVAPFSGLRRFPEGRGFKQWTGDDSKALMKVYLPAIEGHVPLDIVRAFRALLEFCYLVRRNIVTQTTLTEIQDALARFHHYREAFRDAGVVSTFSLPRQHSLKHYVQLIRLFGAPNGLCSSIMETKHIKAVKEPWRRSSRFNALGQMLRTNQRLDKLAALRADFTKRNMLDGTCLSAIVAALRTDSQAADGALPANGSNIDEEGDDNGEVDDGPTVLQAHVELARTPQRKRAKTVAALAAELNIAHLPHLLRQFLFEQIHQDDPQDLSEVPEFHFPGYDGRISVFNSASSRFYSPSDLSGIGGMRTEYIRACPQWRNEYARNDCVFVNTNPDLEGMRGFNVARVLCFFSFNFQGITYPCAVIRWFDTIGDSPDEDTGMWVVRPAYHANHAPHMSIIHIDSIYRAAHLIPIYGAQFVSYDLRYYQSYDTFRAYYVNKYADHHAFEIAF
ncbi:hypothetical protein DEU56DRAFT_738053 [Suillus clintonianus]|uniref:uncharacterized protein n=1 Tax=Suillus clintonianus TaxID=1904413 RepID=UPI001B8674EB|nr:uncharacterized protein DEU56DRAFT_738053 [Suillus clintonianus]KAG2135326.1 hypothetical protein DEU56DRAFT_738053 [Suillus clintonianus]